MGYKCDVCSQGEAAIFCFADSAVMCSSCDSRVHSANKLARKHERVSLTPFKSSVQCDICQEEKAVMFCSEDRALLCRRCDLMIHTANELTSKHQRYLLSGLTPGLKALTGVSGNPETEQSAEPGPSGRGHSHGHIQNCLKQESSRGMGIPKVSSLGQLINSGNNMGGDQGVLLNSSRQTGLHSKFDNSNDPGGARENHSSDNLFESSMNRYGSSSSGMTLAAELLGMPALPEHYSAKDIDAAWFADNSFDDLDADLSSILAVPDLEFPSDSPPLPSGTYLRPCNFPLSSSMANFEPLGGLSPHGSASGSGGVGDGVVPDMREQTSKRQRT